MLDRLLANNVPKNYELIIGADMNAQVGKCDCEEYDAILGPFGIETRNDKGRDLLQTYQCIQTAHYEYLLST
jgi:hypothetical protein